VICITTDVTARNGSEAMSFFDQPAGVAHSKVVQAARRRQRTEVLPEVPRWRCSWPGPATACSVVALEGDLPTTESYL
jgi:hypothetical protein